MIATDTTLKKVDRIHKQYAELCFCPVASLPARMCETREHFRSEPRSDSGVKWRPAPAGIKWGGQGVTGWFSAEALVPKPCHGKPLFLRADIGAREALVFVDAEPRAAFTSQHHEVLITSKAVAGRTYKLSMEVNSDSYPVGASPTAAFTPSPRNSQIFGGFELLLERPDVTAFVYDLRTLLELASVLDEHSLRRGEIVAALAGVYAAVDSLPNDHPEATWRPKLQDVIKIMRPILARRNGPTMPEFGAVGHSHLDTAWLWTLAETHRKAARTFSTAVTHMEEYPECRFMQSSPLHAEMIRREYPALFKRVKKMAKAGRWELNGGMYVESDCNLPSGESFVRQFLIGQRVARELFGRKMDTLWQIDVFGISGSLPQILRGCDVDFFCTQKMCWNDTTRFPFDTFRWKGIDGSEVIAHFPALLNCWTGPEALGEAWRDRVQHPDVQDRVLCAYGYGDGGGGPVRGMLELARRTRDVEGAPRIEQTTVSEFMRGLQRDLTRLPEYCGELYLEYHRGTFTSIAQLKTLNRRVESCLRDTELLCTMASLRGARYPHKELDDIWKTVLTCHFHDVLPGTSVARVNIEAVKALSTCIDAAGSLRDTALGTLTKPGGRKRDKLVIFNTLSWRRTEEMVLDNVPAGMAPDDADIASQWITDVQGRKRLVVSGLSLPALGAIALPIRRSATRTASPFKVTARTFDTPHARVRLDKAGSISSFIDKTTGRQLATKRGKLNALWIGEDVPFLWDNWDIDRDQKLKMKREDRLVSRKVVANGPLHLRVRSVYELGAASRLTQDMVFHSTTPRVDFETVVDWAEKHQLLKAGFELDLLASNARHEIQYGHIERPTHSNRPSDAAQFEVCAHKWTDLSENGFGVALLNDCKYGVSVRGSDIRLSLIKSGTHPDDRGDEGQHTFTYSLLPHACGFSVESVVRPAYELNVAPLVRVAAGPVEDLAALVSVDSPTVIVGAVKWAEKGHAFVVRLYEAGKTGHYARIRFDNRVRSIAETNMIEEDGRKVNIRNAAAKLYFRPFEIKTIRCEL